MTIANPVTMPLSGFTPQHFQLSVAGKVATVTLNRPEKKNPLTFASYRELTDFFLAAQKEEAVKAIVVTGAGGNFSSGGDVFEIIGPLVAMETKDLLKFTRMTGDLVKTMRACPQPVIAAIESRYCRKTRRTSGDRLERNGVRGLRPVRHRVPGERRSW